MHICITLPEGLRVNAPRLKKWPLFCKQHFQMHFCIMIQISLKFVLRDMIDNKQTLDQILAWHWMVLGHEQGRHSDDYKVNSAVQTDNPINNTGLFCFISRHFYTLLCFQSHWHFYGVLVPGCVAHCWAWRQQVIAGIYHVEIVVISPPIGISEILDLSFWSQPIPWWWRSTR